MLCLARADLGTSSVRSSTWTFVFCSKPPSLTLSLSFFALRAFFVHIDFLRVGCMKHILLLILSLLSHNCIGCPMFFRWWGMGNIHSLFICSCHLRHRSASFLPLPSCHLFSRLRSYHLFSFSCDGCSAHRSYLRTAGALQGSCSLVGTQTSSSPNCAEQGTCRSCSSPPAFLCKPDLRVGRRDSVKKLPGQPLRLGKHS